jgi:threonine dehydrogenase-like Zn-dependent dehydrogenase
MPHVIARGGQPKSVVIVGAGPAGLEAARVAAPSAATMSRFWKRPPRPAARSASPRA